ncbi:MAG: hypothetical protein IJS28_12540 [Synergistaceae bacterium]|nr:hypothetical protein [Synergistaceae bacterium]
MSNMKAKTFWLCIFAGVIIRFVLMSLGHNFDFESYCIVGELASAGKNIYANTPRYNYGPVWFTLLGLFWKTSSLFTHSIIIFRCFIVGTLTLADFFIALLISKKAGNFWGAVFFLNPISLIITGYHNQFDNLAVLTGALAILCIEKSSAEREIKPADIYGTALLSLSLITKHIAWAFPLWILLNSRIDTRKKFIYAFIPPLLFLMSFLPYWSEGCRGIIKHVFMYGSFNNFPLSGVGIMAHLGITIPLQKYIFPSAFVLLMTLGAYLFRRNDICSSFMIYTIFMVCVSSAIANQYLAIPCMALILLCRKTSAAYFLLGFLYLLCDEAGLHIPFWLHERFGFEMSFPVKIISSGDVMYTLLAWCLLFCIVHCYRNNTSC